MKAYLAGPMSGIKAFNIPAFDHAAKILRELDFEVVSPAEVDGPVTRAQLLTSLNGDHADLPPSDGGWSAYLARDFRILADDGIEAIITLPGWKTSRGARCEVAVAEALGLMHIELSEFIDLFPDHADLFPDHADMSVDIREEVLPWHTPVPMAVRNAPGFQSPRVHIENTQTPDEVFQSYEDNPERQRQVTGGVKDNASKPRVDLIPSKPLIGVGHVLAFGAKKYKPNNWRLGLRWSDTLGSAMRHLLAFADGQDLDPETGLPHIDQALAQVLFQSEYYHTNTGIDDRWSSTSEADREAAKA
jgi:hypothetical protein